jgi:hypothetical protein
MNDGMNYELSHELSTSEKELFSFLLSNALNADNDASMPLSAICSLMPNLGTEFGDAHKDLLKKMMLFVRYFDKESGDQGFFFILSSMVAGGDGVFYTATPMFLKKLSDPALVKFLVDSGLLHTISR